MGPTANPAYATQECFRSALARKDHAMLRAWISLQQVQAPGCEQYLSEARVALRQQMGNSAYQATIRYEQRQMEDDDE